MDANVPFPGNGLSWDAAFADVQDALATATTGDEIRIAGGTYKPDHGAGDRSASFVLSNGIQLLGGFAGYGQPVPDARDPARYPTTLSGDIGDVGDISDNSYHVLTATAVDSTTVLDGLTIADGNTVGGIPDRGGGGMYLDAASPLVRNCAWHDNHATSGGAISAMNASALALVNCIFSNNAATDNGGATFLLSSSLTFSDCLFFGNYAGLQGGALAAVFSNSQLVRCTFEANIARTLGGAIHALQGSPALRDCQFVRNSVLSSSSTGQSGGGAISTDSANMLIVRCLFDGNIVSDHGGAILNMKGRHRLASCSFNSNQAGDVGGALYSSGNGNGLTLVNCQLLANAGLNQGGGIFAAGTDLVLANCTCYANVCYMPFGGGLYCSAGTLLLANSILWGNRDAAGTQQTAQLYQTAPQPGQVNFCCVQGLTGSLDGTGNIGTDPRFANAAQPAGDSDLRLACDSPCIDAGANDLVPPDFADLDDDGNTTEPTPVDAAAHPRFLDVASVPDTGRGVPPIVDIGAFEYRRVGDMNCDGAVTFADIDAFVLALAGAEAYYAVYPDCDWLNADCNGDGLVNFADIDAFVSRIGLPCR